MRWEDLCWDCLGISLQDLPDSKIQKMKGGQCRSHMVTPPQSETSSAPLVHYRILPHPYFAPPRSSPSHPRPVRHQSPNSAAGLRGGGVSAWTDVEFAAASLWIITLLLSSVHTPECTEEHLQWRELITRKVYIHPCELVLTNSQDGDTGGHGLLGSADPGSAVWFWWLATLWVENQNLLFLPFFNAFSLESLS